MPTKILKTDSIDEVIKAAQSGIKQVEKRCSVGKLHDDLDDLKNYFHRPFGSLKFRGTSFSSCQTRTMLRITWWSNPVKGKYVAIKVERCNTQRQYRRMNPFYEQHYCWREVFPNRANRYNESRIEREKKQDARIGYRNGAAIVLKPTIGLGGQIDKVDELRVETSSNCDCWNQDPMPTCYCDVPDIAWHDAIISGTNRGTIVFRGPVSGTMIEVIVPDDKSLGWLRSKASREFCRDFYRRVIDKIDIRALDTEFSRTKMMEAMKGEL